MLCTGAGCGVGADEASSEEPAVGVSYRSLELDGGVEEGETTEDPEPQIDGGIVPGRRDAGGPALDAGGPRDGGPLDGGGLPFGPLGQWQFNDCSPSSPTLIDTSGREQSAQRTPTVACSPGIAGLSVAFDERRDRVEVPASPALALTSALTVSAWVDPRSGTGPIVNKQGPSGSVFELALERGQVAFTVRLQSGRRTRRVTSRAPITLNRWTHVAGVYDGEFVQLFRDGQLVGLVAATGPLADVDAPVRIGNSLGGQALSGRIDELELWGRALEEFEIRDRSCIRQPPALAISPTSSGPVDPETLFTYDLAVTNNDIGACFDRFFGVRALEVPPLGFSVTSDSFANVPAGQTGHLALGVMGTTDAEPGTYQIPFEVLAFDTGEALLGQVEYILNPPPACFVRTGRELLVRDLSVVEDPLRTRSNGPADDARTGAWTFARLMEDLAPTAEQAPAMVEQVFESWLVDQTINTFNVPARPAMQQAVLDGWPRTASGELDLTQAPVRLLAIVNRLDVRNLAEGHAGEGRFVFGVLSRQNGFEFPLEFTLIFEYRLPGRTTDDVLAWADAWHQLGQLPFPSEEYNVALQAITSRFAGRGAEPGRPNGSALGQFRSNEIALSGRWELREFELSPITGMLEPATVKLTPDNSFLEDEALQGLVANYVNQNEAQILIERHQVPELFEGVRFLGGSSFNDLVAWQPAGIVNPEARHRFSLNTCNGCHASEETGTAFLHIFNRSPGEVANISGFMAGTIVNDPVTGIPRTFNDLGRRNADLRAIVCGGVASTVTTPLPGAPARAAARVSSSAREAFLSRGIGRVH